MNQSAAEMTRHSSRSCRIDVRRVYELLGPLSERFSVDALIECVSTSSLLLERARQGARPGTVLVADRQSGGRGRRGRSWLSSADGSLTFSLLWRFDAGGAGLSGLSLAVGLAVARALEHCGAEGVGLKWPNDILLADGKVGGILIDLESVSGGSLAVIGIGLNLQLPPAGDEDFLQRPAALAQVLTSLPEREKLLAQLLIDLASVLDRFASGGFAPLRSEWQSCHVWQGRQVRLLDGARVDRQGCCLGADNDGALLLQTDAGVERCFSGDVSLRTA